MPRFTGDNSNERKRFTEKQVLFSKVATDHSSRVSAPESGKHVELWPSCTDPEAKRRRLSSSTGRERKRWKEGRKDLGVELNPSLALDQGGGNLQDHSLDRVRTAPALKAKGVGFTRKQGGGADLFRQQLHADGAAAEDETVRDARVDDAHKGRLVGEIVLQEGVVSCCPPCSLTHTKEAEGRAKKGSL